MIRSVWVSGQINPNTIKAWSTTSLIQFLSFLSCQVRLKCALMLMWQRWSGLLTDFRHRADCCVRAFGDFHVALPGDACFGALYRRLLVDPLFRMLPWRKTHLWMLDAYGDGEPAADLIGGWLHDHTDLPREQWHPFRDEDPKP